MVNIGFLSVHCRFMEGERRGYGRDKIRPEAILVCTFRYFGCMKKEFVKVIPFDMHMFVPRNRTSPAIEICKILRMAF